MFTSRQGSRASAGSLLVSLYWPGLAPMGAGQLGSWVRPAATNELEAANRPAYGCELGGELGRAGSWEKASWNPACDI